MNAIDFRRHDVLSFDCYGTLVDWEAGILDAIRPLLESHGVRTDDRAILETYAKLETKAQEGIYAPYRHVLARVVKGIARQHGFEIEGHDRNLLADSLPRWPPFPDTRVTLPRLQRYFRLGVISNIDDDLFAETRSQLGVALDWVLTAEEVASYKPLLRNFELAVRKVGVEPERWLHAAQSLYHDIVPARELGMTTIWVNRRRGREGFGATPPVAAMPHLEVADLGELLKLVESSR